MKQNHPNPFNPETNIGFTVGDFPTCTDTKKHVVTIRILNALAQQYAIPTISAAGTKNVAGGAQINKLSLGCGEFNAYWNGEVIGTRRKAASGNYVYTLEIDGRVVASGRMMVSK